MDASVDEGVDETVATWLCNLHCNTVRLLTLLQILTKESFVKSNLILFKGQASAVFIDFGRLCIFQHRLLDNKSKRCLIRSSKFIPIDLDFEDISISVQKMLLEKKKVGGKYLPADDDDDDGGGEDDDDDDDDDVDDEKEDDDDDVGDDDDDDDGDWIISVSPN